MSKSLKEQGLVSPYEFEIISVSEQAGRINQGLRHIAISYRKRMTRVGRLKSKLYYPFAVLTIGIIVSTIMQISSNSSPGGTVVHAIFRSILILITIFLLTRTVLNLMQKDASTWLGYFSKYSSTKWYRKQFQQIVFGALLWQVSSGISFKDGFRQVASLFASHSISKKLNNVSNQCGQGLSVSEAVKKSKLPITSDFQQVLITGEESGRWVYAVKQYLEQSQIQLDLSIDNMFDWAPRIYYFMIIIFAISVIL